MGAALAMIFLVTLTSCITRPPSRTDLFDFFNIGKTTREEIMLQLGQPSGSFENDRILTYRVGQYREEGYYIVSPKSALPTQGGSWAGVRYSLVIVFDEKGRLQKHQLVPVE